MNLEDREKIRNRVDELAALTGDVTAAAVLDLGDRIVGVLDGILSRLRTIEDKLETVKKEQR